MKILVFSLLSVFFFLQTSFVSAQEAWTIKNFVSDISLEESGMVIVVETIDVDFGNLQKHGIFRDIPFVYHSDDNSLFYTNVEVVSVVANGSNVPYLVQTQGEKVRIRVGDPERTVSGIHSYTIHYQVKGVVRGFSDFDELYWNVTGNDWEVPLEKVSATVSLPASALIQAACYQGTKGSSETCAADKLDQKIASFETSRRLSIGEGMSVAVGFSKGLVPLLVGEKPVSIFDRLFAPFNLGIFFLTFTSGLGGVFWLWLRKGRDFWWRSRFLADPTAKHEVKPVGAHETIVVEYESPDKLRPAEIGALLDERADTLDVTATLVDLANRGYLTVTEEKKKWLFGSTDYVLSQKKTDRVGLLNYEKELLDRLFETGDLVSLSSLKQKFYKDLSQVKNELYQDMVDKRFFVENPSSVRTKYSLVSIGVLVLGAVAIWIGFSSIQPALVAGGSALDLVGIVFVLIAQFMPARTAAGRQMYVRSRGYRMFVERAEKYRQQFFEKKNLFNEILPYAIVFGLTEKFAKAFAKMGLEPEQPSWYTGSAPFNAVVFGSSMASFSKSFSSAIASTPSSSGSGGGGFSGGGFGGGGGGSW